MENVFKLGVASVFSAALIWSTLAGSTPDHYSAGNDVTDFIYKTAAPRLLWCYYGFVDADYRDLKATFCKGSCQAWKNWIGQMYSCSNEIVEDGCIQTLASNICYCNQPLCNPLKQERTTLLRSKTNQISSTTEVQSDENKSDKNAGAIPDHYSAGNDVTDFIHLKTAAPRILWCWYGYVDVEYRKLEVTICKGSCQALENWIGLLYSCSDEIVEDGCITASNTCYCNQPLCNPLKQERTTLLRSKTNLISSTTEVQSDENKSDKNAAETSSPDQYSLGNDVTGFNTNPSDAQGRFLSCWFGYTMKGYMRLVRTLCHGSCETREYRTVTLHVCGYRFMKDGCITEAGSKSCYCNQPFCNHEKLEKRTLFRYQTRLTTKKPNKHFDEKWSNGDTAGNDVADNIYVYKRRLLWCWYGYVDDDHRRFAGKVCNGSCEAREYRKGIWYDCADKIMKDGCITESKICYCNKPLCIPRKQNTNTLLRFKTNLVSSTTEVHSDENKSDKNTGSDVSEPFPLAYGDVIDQSSNSEDKLQCWSGFWGQGRETREEMECHGSCVTRVYMFGIIFGCGERTLSEDCRRDKGSVSCFCNEPLCNNGTIPSISL